MYSPILYQYLSLSVLTRVTCLDKQATCLLINAKVGRPPPSPLPPLLKSTTSKHLLIQERHPPSKEAKRLLKQRSQESFKNEETVRSKGTDWTNHR